MKKQSNDECVICGEITNTPSNMPVDYRPHYIEGAGQLCAECYDKLYKNIAACI